jgi:argininosuccinate synthase
MYFPSFNHQTIADHDPKNVYLLGTSLARPVIARGMIAVAEREGCE